MKSIMLLLFLFISGKAYCQPSVNHTVRSSNEGRYMMRCVRMPSGQDRRIIYFFESNEYYFCGEDATARRKLPANQRLLDKLCDCDTGDRPLSPVMSIPGNMVYFEFNSSVLPPSSYPVLDSLAANLKADTERKITLAGYSSSEGAAADNIRLSTDRANSVKTYLVNSGVDVARIKTRGYGENNPVASNESEQGRIQNRRVEIKP